jgi:hypothetical protein
LISLWKKLRLKKRKCSLNSHSLGGGSGALNQIYSNSPSLDSQDLF